MFVDASVMVAILLEEPDADSLADGLESGGAITSPVALFEAVSALMRRRSLPRALAEERVMALLAAAKVEIVAITAEHGRAALDAFERYGKGGGNPAQLNLGDCFAYAGAKLAGVRLLYKGSDFARTDIAGPWSGPSQI